MDSRIKQVIAESRIIRFFANLNKNLLFFFYNSKTHGIFVKLNIFFKDAVLKNAQESVILRLARKGLKSIGLKDIGLFIVLVVAFNTLAMIVLKNEIDIFSISARVFFFVLGTVLFVWGRNVRNMRIR